MGKIQGTLATAISFCVIHSFSDRQADMRPMWGWFAAVLTGISIILALFSHFRKSLSTQQQQENINVSTNNNVKVKEETIENVKLDENLQSKSEFEKITTPLVFRVGERLREMLDNPGEKHTSHVDFLKEHGGFDGIDKYRRNLLWQVMSVCDHAYSVHLSPVDIPDIPDSSGSLRREIQRWTVMASGIKLTRGLDIRAGMEVKQPFEHMMHDREYLLAIVKKNAGDDGTGTGKMDVADYENHTGPEITYMLIVEADKYMFESELWAYAACYAGDEDFLLTRYDKAGLTAVKSSLEYWQKYTEQI
jgi:hypothetical protein